MILEGFDGILLSPTLPRMSVRCTTPFYSIISFPFYLIIPFLWEGYDSVREGMIEFKMAILGYDLVNCRLRGVGLNKQANHLPLIHM